MLALLEHCVTELGGTYAMEDTDSMAIVATKRGGFVPCPGGNLVKNGVEDRSKCMTLRGINLKDEKIYRIAMLPDGKRDTVVRNHSELF